MNFRRTSINLLIAAILPAMAISLPTMQAQAKDGRNAAFAVGLIAGAVGGAAIVNANSGYRTAPPRRYYRPPVHDYYRPPERRYYRPAPPPPPRYYRAAPPPPRYYRPAPWTREWYSYCHSKYRSFNPRTGYFTTYSGYQKFCR
ncbi:BA14K family protein [uncultured Cohaesibacter sp.]|uniref:BA14K family protein n=1 Tax=uncultured Cohaesibacter sp. TaxID=1002546 RepID=UPI002931A008|nr:BA14K family protein [uncultured Cohaesibacter sp.]